MLSLIYSLCTEVDSIWNHWDSEEANLTQTCPSPSAIWICKFTGHKWASVSFWLIMAKFRSRFEHFQNNRYFIVERSFERCDMSCGLETFPKWGYGDSNLIVLVYLMPDVIYFSATALRHSGDVRYPMRDKQLFTVWFETPVRTHA